MTNEEATLVLKNYPCVCEYGKSPTNCKDDKCPFGQAIRLLTETAEACNIIDGLNNEIDDLSEKLAWYINERNRLLKERRPITDGE